jgi:dipeptidyl-peptidase-4
MSNAISRILISFSLVAILGASVVGQQRTALTPDDYTRAERFLAPAVTPLVVGGAVSATWLADDRFWYRNAIAGGTEFILVDPLKKTRSRAFNHEKVAAALSAASGAKLDPLNLVIQGLTPSSDGTAIAFNLAGKRWTCDVDGAKCADTGVPPTTVSEAADPPAGGRGGRGGRGGAATRTSTDGKPLNMSPDGKRGIFIREWNLWVQDVATRQERQLTTDGVKYFGYATDNAGWTSSDRAIALWSPDSTKVATQQQDEREVGELYFVPTVPGHPTLRVSKYPLPGDKVMAMLHRVVIDVDSGKTVRLQMEPDLHRGTLSDNINVRDYSWSPDGTKLALASVSRDHKQAWLRVADTATGAVRTVLDEKVTTQYESRTGWQVLWRTNEVIWYSERNDWGNLYLYNLSTGVLKHPITTGEGPVTQIERVDEKTRTLWYAANGRDKTRDPYFTSYYRISLDATGGRAPTPITMKAADGKTDIYGMMFTPSKMDAGREVSDRESGVSRSADRQHRQPRLHRRARRSAGACRARLHRGHHRRPRHTRTLEGRSWTRTTAPWAGTTPFPIRSRA